MTLIKYVYQPLLQKIKKNEEKMNHESWIMNYIYGGFPNVSHVIGIFLDEILENSRKFEKILHKKIKKNIFGE